MKSYYVADQWKYHEVCGEVEAKSKRQAVLKLLEDKYGRTSPKLFKIYVDKKDGSIEHVGYGCGRYWFSIRELV